LLTLDHCVLFFCLWVFLWVRGLPRTRDPTAGAMAGEGDLADIADDALKYETYEQVLCLQRTRVGLPHVRAPPPLCSFTPRRTAPHRTAPPDAALPPVVLAPLSLTRSLPVCARPRVHMCACVRACVAACSNLCVRWLPGCSTSIRRFRPWTSTTSRTRTSRASWSSSG
jgi:hypothetical protein